MSQRKLGILKARFFSSFRNWNDQSHSCWSPVKLKGQETLADFSDAPFLLLDVLFILAPSFVRTYVPSAVTHAEQSFARSKCVLDETKFLHVITLSKFNTWKWTRNQTMDSIKERKTKELFCSLLWQSLIFSPFPSLRFFGELQYFIIIKHVG